MSFRPLDLSRPFAASLSAHASRGVTVRGLFLSEYVADLRALGVEWPTRIVPFKVYPAIEVVNLVSKLAELRYPKLPVRQAWHEIVACQYPLLRQSLVGRVVFGALGDNLPSVMQLANKGYSIASPELGPVRTLEIEEDRAVVELERQSMPIEGWHSGVLAGAILAMKRQPTTITVDLLDEFNGKLELRWR